jgi:hypothetical protein
MSSVLLSLLENEYVYIYMFIYICTYIYVYICMYTEMYIHSDIFTIIIGWEGHDE